MVSVKVKRTSESSALPTKAHESDACFDLYADIPREQYRYGLIGVEISSTGNKKGWESGVVIPPKMAVTIPTGITTEIPNGYFAAVFSRSGMGFKHNLRLSNSVGIIDADYRGEWMVKIYNDGYKDQIIHHGDRIAQFTILPVLDVELTEVDSLESTERGAGGFGSTGN